MQNKIFFRKKITLSVLGLILALIFLELSLRLGGVVVRSVQEYKNLQSIARGGTYRVLCIGESTTQNQYPRFLSDALDQSGTGIAFRVIDKGLSGTDSSVIVSMMESYLDNYHPQMVVAMMGCNDRSVIYYQNIPEANSVFFKNCRIYRLMRMIYLRLREKWLNGKKPAAEALAASQNNVEISQREKDLKQRIAAHPTDARNYSNLGWFYVSLGKLDMAQKILKQGIAADPQNSSCYSALGCVFTVLGKSGLAVQSFKRAIAVNPKNSRCYGDLGDFYLGQGKAKAVFAEKAFKQGIFVNPADIRCYLGLGAVYQKQNRLALAEEYFLKGSSLNPDDHRIYGLLTLLYGEKDQANRAQEYYRKANELRFNKRNAITAQNYQRLEKMLKKRGVRLVCVQYPMRSIEPLKKIFQGDREGIIFVDNEKVFRDAVKRDGYSTYFVDIFGGDFGHCTDKGNKLLAENIARVVLKGVFHK